MRPRSGVARMAARRGKKREAEAEKLFSRAASNFTVTGKGLLKRVLMTLALSSGLLMLLAALDAHATPIRPDIRQILAQPPEDTTARSMPARAGWDGPEMRVGQQDATPAMDSLSADHGARAERAELIAAATPDPRAILGIVALIFLLRLLRQQDQKRVRGTPALEAEEMQERIAA
jgi:hypothetical protein